MAAQEAETMAVDGMRSVPAGGLVQTSRRAYPNTISSASTNIVRISSTATSVVRSGLPKQSSRRSLASSARTLSHDNI